MKPKMVKVLFLIAIFVSTSLYANNKVQMASQDLEKENSKISTEVSKLEVSKETVKNVEVLAKPASGKQSPSDFIKQYESELREVVKQYEGKTDEVSLKARKKKLSEKVKRYFDFDELARLSLGDHWSSAKSNMRERFIEAFRKLIERSYLDKTNNLVIDYQVVYGDEKVDGKYGEVVSIIRKQDLDVEVTYLLKQSKSGWLIYNVVLDELNLLNNYRSQFNRIITKKSFAELVKIMEKRVNEPAATS